MTQHTAQSFWSATYKHLKDHFIAFIFSTLFGVILAISLFALTAPPKTTAEVRQALLTQVEKEVCSQFNIHTKSLDIDSLAFFTTETDVGMPETVILAGQWMNNLEGSLCNYYVAIFDPEQDSILDKLSGRNSFYSLSSFTSIQNLYPNNFEVTEFESIDIDNDGSKELHLRVRATWGDGVSVSPLIFKRKTSRGWQLITLPSVEQVALEIIDGKQPHPGFAPLHSPHTIFAGDYSGTYTNTAIGSITNLFPISLYQDELETTHNGKNRLLYLLRNGGEYQLRKHLIKKHFQIATVAQMDDGTCVQGDHHLLVTFFEIFNNNLRPDVLWNWGYPMISTTPLKMSDIFIEDIAAGGIDAHVVGNSFFGYTDFQRLEVKLGGQPEH